MNQLKRSEAEILQKVIEEASKPSSIVREDRIGEAGSVVKTAYESGVLNNLEDCLYVIRELVAEIKLLENQ